MKKSNTKPKRVQPVYINGKKVGAIIGDTLEKHVRGSYHMLRDPKGWAWNIGILKKADKAGVLIVLIIDDESGKIYHATLSEYWAFGQPVEYFNYGPQLVLTLDHWQIEEVPHG